MNLNGFFDQPSPFMITPPATKPTGRQNQWIAQHKAKLQANAKKRVAVKPKAQTAPLAAPVVAAPQAPKESALDKWVSIAQQAAPGVIATITAAKNQKRIDKYQDSFLKINGRAPTTEEIDQYMDATAPVVKVKGGIDDNTNKYLLWGGLGIAGLFLIMRNKPSAKNG